MTDHTPHTEDRDKPESQEESAPDQNQGEESIPGTGQCPDGAPLVSKEQIALLQQERDELRDQLLRSRAEFANYQKRARQQADADRIYAVGDLARDLLDALDNLDRATTALAATASEGIVSGLDMVQKQFLGILSKYGVEPIPAVGHPFDPNVHEALLQQPSDDHPEGTVLSELNKGYKIHDRVLRPSKVAVSAKPAAG